MGRCKPAEADAWRKTVDLPGLGSQRCGTPVTKRSCSTIVDAVSERDDCPVTQQAFAAIRRSDVVRSLDIAGRIRLSKYFACPFEVHAEQISNFTKVKPDSVSLEPAIDFPAARRTNIFHGVHRVRIPFARNSI